jgi:cell division inhibitor SepF
MSSLFSKAMVYLGLVDEDQIEAEAGETQPVSTQQMGQRGMEVGQHRVDPMAQGRRVEPPPTSRAANVPQGRRIPSAPSVSGVQPVEIQSDILVVEEFTDARMLADRIRDRTPVVMDMRATDHDLVRRVIDFSSGLIYALDGSMRRVGDGLVVVLPPRVTLSRDEKRRLASLGAYELDDID